MAAQQATPHLVTIPSALALMFKELASADTAVIERAVEALQTRCTQNAAGNLSMIRRSFLESATIAPFSKLSKKCMDSSKAVLAITNVILLLIKPPARGMVSDCALLR